MLAANSHGQGQLVLLQLSGDVTNSNQYLYADHPGRKPKAAPSCDLVKVWVPYPGVNISACLMIHDSEWAPNVFVTASETGVVSLWSTLGELLCSISAYAGDLFGTWPVGLSPLGRRRAKGDTSVSLAKATRIYDEDAREGIASLTGQKKVRIFIINIYKLMYVCANLYL